MDEIARIQEQNKTQLLFPRETAIIHVLPKLNQRNHHENRGSLQKKSDINSTLLFKKQPKDFTGDLLCKGAECGF